MPYYEDESVTIYNADHRDVIIEGIPIADAIVTDPPYGMDWDTNTARFIGGNPSKVHGSVNVGRGRADWPAVRGDNAPFDPSPWLVYSQVILWGANHFAQRLPVGTTLVWIKRFDGGFGSFLSDAEVAWMKGGHGVYCHRDTSLMGETHHRYHPTQKPVGLMEWCIAKTTGTILDPFMGSGSTLRAAKNVGRKAIGIEIEERYCEIAATRLAQGVLFGIA